MRKMGHAEKLINSPQRTATIFSFKVDMVMYKIVLQILEFPTSCTVTKSQEDKLKDHKGSENFHLRGNPREVKNNSAFPTIYIYLNCYLSKVILDLLQSKT